MKQARYDTDSMRTNNTPSQMWTNEEVLQACNTAMDTAARLLRLSGSDLLTRTMNSNDPGQVLVHENYTPNLNIRIQPDQSSYTLPENCVRIVSIRPITTGFEATRFHPIGTQDSMYLSLRSIPTDQLPSANSLQLEYYYVVTGARTLTISPTPKDMFDIEIVYHIRPAKLRYTQTGTVQRIAGQVTVVGTGTSWLSDNIRFPADLLVKFTNINDVDLDVSYPTIGDDLVSDTTLTLSKPSLFTDGVGHPYILAMTPKLPEEHHTWLAQFVAAIMMRKVDIDLSMKLQADLSATFVGSITPEVTLRQLQESLVTEAFSVPG